MEIHRFLKKNGLDIAHLPTLFLIIGYPVYWLELYVFKSSMGVTSFLATALFLIAAVLVLFSGWASLRKVISLPESGPEKILVFIGGTVAAAILGVALYAALLPPHLMQELDVINYHYTLPRQHLIAQSFAHLSWSSADLFPLPVQFALAPFWFVTELPNKVPQFLFLLGLLLVSVNLIQRFDRRLLSVSFVCFAILGSHGIGIQMGTGMLDVVICYLLLAAFDSFLRGYPLLAAIEFTFFFWAKSFIPVQMMVIVFILAIIWFVLKRVGFNLKWDSNQTLDFAQDSRQFKKFILNFVVLSVLVGGPFVVKSLYCAGTPLYPLATGKMMINPHLDESSPGWQSLLRAAEDLLGARDVYGLGRSGTDFLRHFWLIAVPDKGVNNAFDYPLGLPYLLLIGPFVWLLFSSCRKKEFPLLAWFIVIYWLSWWIGSQQTRFLYISLVLMFIIVIGASKSSRLLLTLLIMAMGLNFLSVFRANKPDFGLKGEGVLRLSDTEIVKMNKDYLSQGRKDVITLDDRQAAFARFPITFAKERLPFVLTVNP